MVATVIKVKSWDEFKRLIIKHKPASIAYNIEQGIPAKNLTSVRFILPTRYAQFVFIDTAIHNQLRKMKIPLSKDKSGNIYIKDEDLIKFIRSQVKIKNLRLHPYWSA
ncbi:TPA: hypothetical protein EYP70_06525 [Candidatus Bathyarchaeota archaeon]|nr:hypothetical protein [Candidatus Bathyarchaeota archaeon]